jgi:hypothetical protein
VRALAAWPPRTIWRVLFWVAVMFGFAWALRHAPLEAPWIPYEDKVKHALSFWVLVLLGWRGGYRSALKLGLGLLGLGVAIELAQSLTPWRSAEAADVLADGAGIAIGLWMARRLPGQPGEHGG